MSSWAENRGQSERCRYGWVFDNRENVNKGFNHFLDYTDVSQAMIATKQDILDLLSRNQDSLQAFGVKDIGLFGSFVRDEQHADSDIDLLVTFYQGKKTFDNFMELASFLERILGRRVELVTLESLSPYLGPHILNEVEYAAIVA